jgi:ankyrin repeat protein
MKKNIYQIDHTQVPRIFELIKEFKNMEAIDHLSENPGEINLKGWMDHTPLHKAAECGNFELVKYLVTNGAKINASRSGLYATPLCWAKNINVAKFLLDNGATMNDRELDMATRYDRVEIIDELLKRGAKINILEPQFLNCHSIEALNVYLKYNVDITLTNQNHSSILHKKAWDENIEVFEHAFKNGVQWNKDSSNRNPYVLAKQGQRKKIIKYIEATYPELISNKIKKLEITYCTDRIIHIENYKNSDDHFIGLTSTGKLISFKADGDRLSIIRTIEVDLPTIRNFTINDKNEIVLPTGSNILLIIESTRLELIRKVRIKSRELDQITFCIKKQTYICSSRKWEIFTLNQDFQEINHINAEDGTIKPYVRADELYLLFWSYDQESFFDLYYIDPTSKLEFLHTFFKDWKNPSLSARFIGDKILVIFPSVIELFKVVDKKLIKLDEYKIERKKKDDSFSSSIAILDVDKVLLSISNNLFLFSITEKIIPLRSIRPYSKKPIQLLHYLPSEKKLIACSNSQLNLYSINEITGHNIG